MKKKLLLPLFLSSIMILAACSSSKGGGSKDDPTVDPTTDPTPEPTPEPTPQGEVHPVDLDLGPAPEYGEPTLYMHYWRKDNKYANWDLWMWQNGFGDGAYQFNGKDNWGVIAAYPLSTWTDPLENQIGFIYRKGNWEQKDLGGGDTYINLHLFDADEKGNYHVYAVSGPSNQLYIDEELHMHGAITGATFIATVSGYAIKVESNLVMTSLAIYEDDDIIASAENYTKNTYTFSFPKGTAPSLEKEYTVVAIFENEDESQATVSKTKLYDIPEFTAHLNYDGELGAIYSKTGTEFKVWSPVSTSIKLRLFDYGQPIDGEIVNEYQMVKGEKGVFSTRVSGDLAGKYYTYVVTNSSYIEREIVDPYARSCGLNGKRGMIVDFEQTNPTNWDKVEPHHYKPTELVVYETHVADVTSSATWNGTEANRKLFKGMYEAGTKYEGVATGFDHIKELEVNAVQLIPIFDQANDEANMTFNWGYNPENYNCLEGGYSSDPTDGYVRIREFKELVKAYNFAGMNIIMDVVYNHVNGANGSNFDVLMPGYYYRYNNTGTLSNGSGCGNETASDHYMMRKFMIDSATFLAKEYKLGGFRFDLMGLHDIETMNQLVASVKEVNEYAVVYGEPWTGGDTPLASKNQAKQSNQSKFVGYGAFNDKFRDALIAGGLSGKKDLGFITGKAKPDSASIIAGFKGITNASGCDKDPNKTVNYVTCHDNYTLFDRAVATGNFNENETEKLAKMNILANSMTFASQGISFMLAGEEFLRTKGGNSNSYNASYEVNELNYALKVEHPEMVRAYTEMISLKTGNELFSLDKASDIESLVKAEFVDDNYFFLEIGDASRQIALYFTYTGGRTTQEFGDKYNYAYSITYGDNVQITNQTVTLRPFDVVILGQYR